MNVPTNIKHILDRIENSESEWKALYMAVWDYSYKIKEKIKQKEIKSAQSDYLAGATVNLPSTITGTAYTSSLVSVVDFRGTAASITNVVAKSQEQESLKSVIELELPASKRGSNLWELEELHSILTSRDGQFTVGHLQTLFSLLEERD
ncbi:MAG: hypothetical protein WC488_05385 [Candidatus Micrarchaeia archaeon]